MPKVPSDLIPAGTVFCFIGTNLDCAAICKQAKVVGGLQVIESHTLITSLVHTVVLVARTLVWVDLCHRTVFHRIALSSSDDNHREPCQYCDTNKSRFHRSFSLFDLAPLRREA